MIIICKIGLSLILILFFVCSKKKNADDDSRQDHISIDYRVNPVPFSDEWVAALEAVGEVS